MRNLALLLASAAAALALSACAAPAAAEKGPPPASRFRAEAESVVARLSLDEKCAQVLLVGVGGRGSPSADSLELVSSLAPGGVVLFGFNIGEEASSLGPFVARLQDAAAASAPRLPLLVALDHEGGSVFRFRSGVTRLPPPAEVGARGAPYAGLLGERAGLELKALGVNLVLAPVVELLDADNRALLGGRSYGAEPAVVDAAAGAFIRGLQASGVAATAKHFPGNAGLDPHKGLPVLAASKAELEASYFPRFAAASRAGVGAVLLSHVLVPAMDAKRPATLSPALIEELKGRLRFEGVVLTDDLFMGAVAGERPPERSAVEALAAGADLLMLSAGGSAARVRQAIRRAVESGALPEARLDDACARVVAMKLRFSLSEAFDREARAERLAAFPGLVEESSLLLRARLAEAGKSGGKAPSFPAAAGTKTP